MKSKDLIKITIPVMALQFIEFGSMFIDAVMVGNYDPIKFGAVSLSGAIYYSFFTFFYGIILMLGPLIGQARGANNKYLIARNVRGGIVMGFIFAIILFVLCLYIVEIASPLKFSDDITSVMDDFLAGKKYSAIIFLALPLRYFLINQGIIRPVLLISILIFPLNIIFNYIFIYGYGLIPEMGVYGAGLATSLSVIISCLLLVIFTNGYAKKQAIPLYENFFSLDFQIYRRILKYGIPSGIALSMEMILFSVNNIYVAYFDPYSISAFAATFQFWNVNYAITLGFAEGVGISIAHSSGKKDYSLIISTLKKSVLWLVGLIFSLSMIYYFCSVYIYKFMLDMTNPESPAIFAIIASLKILMILGIIFESCVQLPIKFLQSINDTKYIPVGQFIGYGLVGPLTGYILCFEYDYKTDGLYIAMVIGIVTTLVILIGRVIYSMNQDRIFKKVETK